MRNPAPVDTEKADRHAEKTRQYRSGASDPVRFSAVPNTRHRTQDMGATALDEKRDAFSPARSRMIEGRESQWNEAHNPNDVESSAFRSRVLDGGGGRNRQGSSAIAIAGPPIGTDPGSASSNNPTALGVPREKIHG